MKKTGKDFYRNLIILLSCFACFEVLAADGEGLSRIITDVKTMGPEQILFHEKDHDQIFRERYLKAVEECRTIGEASEERENLTNLKDQNGINQGLCFEKLVEYKKTYSLIKHEARKKILIKASQLSLKEIEKVQEAKIKLIQHSSPEEIAPFEL